MKRIIPLLIGLAFALALAISACAKRQADVVGSWQMDAGIAKATMVLAAEGTYTETLSGVMAGSITGTWHVVGAELVQVVETSTIDENNAGKEFRQKIVSATRESLTLADSDGKAFTYVRLK
jgi:hypothetical protein